MRLELNLDHNHLLITQYEVNIFNNKRNKSVFLN